MKVIEVNSPKYGKHQILVDDDKYDLVKGFHWTIYKPSVNTFHACTTYKNVDIHLHRFLMGVSVRNQYVDHINRNGLDNRICNLRISTGSQNCANVPARGKTSEFKGVSLSDNRFCVYIKHKYVSYPLGRFSNTPFGELLAAIAYDQAAVKFHGEFAWLNFPLLQRKEPRTQRLDSLNNLEHNIEDCLSTISFYSAATAILPPWI